MNGEIGVIENIKRLNMVEFLSRHYGLEFSGNSGVVRDQYCCLSPFKAEKNRSFFVRQVHGHWLFKDFSSGHGGSLIDFVLLKEGFSHVHDALSHIEHLMWAGADILRSNQSVEQALSTRSSMKKEYDVDYIYQSLRGNDVSICVDYLLSRGISKEVVEHLCGGNLVLNNNYKGNSYCCFAVFNAAGQLRCLDNHQIGGGKKFVLGHKHPFSLDWDEFSQSERVYVSESVIDYLSLKTLEGLDISGVALLGNIINFDSELFCNAHEIVSALDGDPGGFSAFLDLEEMFSERVIHVYDFGDSKDANEYLQKQSQLKLKRLSAEDKLSLYRDFQRSGNKTEVALKWGINRSYMYEIVKECEELILSGFSDRRAGRPPSDQPETLPEAHQKLENLKEENRRLDEERERYYVRSEFLKVRLKWAEREAQELSGELGKKKSSETKNRKKHLKKKRRKKS